MTDESLLPPTATKLERLLEMVMQPTDELRAAIEKIGTVKTDIITTTIPFLIYEYGLEEVMPYLLNPSRALQEGRQWQRIRATPEAIHMALSWINVAVNLEESPDDIWWDLFQLELEKPPKSLDELNPIIGLTRLSKPTHTDVIRIYSGHDVRILNINEGMINGAALINDWSGVWYQEGQPKISFGADLIEHSQAMLDYTARDISPAQLITYTPLGEGLHVNRDYINSESNLEDGRFVESVGGNSFIHHMGYFDEPEPWPIGPWPDEPYGSMQTISSAGWPLGPWQDEPYGLPRPSSVSVLITET